MKKKALIYVLLIIGTLLFSTTNVQAKEKNKYKIDEKYTVNTTIANVATQSNSLVQIALDCSGEATILGNVNDPDSVAWLLQKILNYLRVLAPFLTLVLSSLDYVKAILSSDDESLAKAHKKLIYRLLLAAALFVLPTLVSVMLNVLGFTSSGTCVS